MKVLVACEESQRVCSAFRARGHEAYSCDIIECSGGHPEWHIMEDCLPLINGNCTFKTMDGEEHHVEKWDLLIAHPPCTYLTVTGNRWFNVEKYGDKARERIKLREEAKEFFMKFANADCDKIMIENPVGVMSTAWRKPDQIVQPYYFGDPFEKRTCLWLKGLRNLIPTDVVDPTMGSWVNGCARAYKIKGKENIFGKSTAKERSKTFPGIAKAMAEQWG